MRPMIRPTASAVSAPTQMALQTGQGRQPDSSSRSISFLSLGHRCPAHLVSAGPTPSQCRPHADELHCGDRPAAGEEIMTAFQKPVTTEAELRALIGT